MPAGKSRGYTFVGVLLLLALCMLSLAVAGPVWSQQVRREREQELLRVGGLYAQAIASYYQASPGSEKQFPQRLDQLLNDTRFVGVRRHLRALYPDPVSPGQPWGLVLDAQQRIVGVHSLSEQPPLAEGRLEAGGVELAPAKHYSDWKFIAKVNKT
ncbi:type II secretion system protein [Ideonella sp. BN130291]|uniref:type II secretion system protein n=1 Tax=Ideonella sp. BN130291 TaxID=3112940 RepID=UPI002E256210|nr:type II secretion system protein [Ideonella sp. BN130291]